MANNGNSWSVERVILLVKFWGDGLSASKIARELGGVTRNAVLGRAFRMNLPKRQTISSIERKRPKRGPREPKQRWVPRPHILRPPEEVLPPPEFIGIPLLETTRFSCMYPEGEGASIMFCGQPRKDGSSFCPGHHRICYHKVDPNRKSLRIAA